MMKIVFNEYLLNAFIQNYEKSILTITISIRPSFYCYPWLRTILFYQECGNSAVLIEMKLVISHPIHQGSLVDLKHYLGVYSNMWTLQRALHTSLKGKASNYGF